MEELVQKTEAERLRQEIYDELDSASLNVCRLEQSWMRLGSHLSQFKAIEAWRPLGYQSFDAFVEEIKSKVQRGRTQIYQYISVAETLSDIPADKLEEMGVSKALEIKRLRKKLAGKPVPPEVLEKAALTATTTKELRATIAELTNVSTGPEDRGSWFDLDGCFMTVDERKEFVEIVKVTTALLGLKSEIPDHIKRKEIIFAWMHEWFGTHAAEFYGPVPSHATEPKLLHSESACGMEPF